MASSSVRPPKTQELTPEQKLAVYRQIVGIPQYAFNGFGHSQSAVNIERSAPGRGEERPKCASNSKGNQARALLQKPSALLPPSPPKRHKKSGVRRGLCHLVLPYTDPPVNKGIYHHILAEEGKTTLHSYISYALITTLLLLQVVIAAIITSLSAWGSHRIPLIALGATSTIVASIAAWLKGQGLPNRAHQYRYAMGRVRLQAELVDSKFQCRELAAKLDPVEEGQHVVDMYVAAKSDHQKNEPDFYSFDSEWQANKDRLVTQAVAAGRGKEDVLARDVADAMRMMRDLVGTIGAREAAGRPHSPFSPFDGEDLV